MGVDSFKDSLIEKKIINFSVVLNLIEVHILLVIVLHHSTIFQDTPNQSIGSNFSRVLCIS